MATDKNKPQTRADIYTEAQRLRRDSPRWTLIQGVLAPLQFVAFGVSLVFVANYLANDTGYFATTLSILVKTGFLYAIMVTGAIWEKVVFGRYLFAGPFFWEDVVSMGVIALHTAYVLALWFDWLPARELVWLAVAAYAAYLVNAAQFLLKFRLARLSAAPRMPSTEPAMGASG